MQTRQTGLLSACARLLGSAQRRYTGRLADFLLPVTSMSPRILFVEDDLELAGLIGEFLTRNGFVLHHIDRGDLVEAAIAEHDPDLLLLDIMLPGKDGLSICRDLRPGFTRPIILLTSVGSDMNQVLGLELGANDYVIKTTPPAVLLARIRAQLRQHEAQGGTAPARPSAAAPANILHFGRLVVDAANRDVKLDGHSVILSTSDFDLLWLLASHAGEILSRDTLLKALRGVEYDGLDRSIDVAVSRLRKKLGDDPNEPHKIKTVRNKGYLFVRAGWDA